MSLTGSAFEGSGEINSTDMLQSGTSYVSHDLTGDNSTFGGSYAPVEKGVHQCGGGRRKKSRARKSNRKSNRNRNKARKSNRNKARKSNRNRKNKKNKTRKNKKNKRN